MPRCGVCLDDCGEKNISITECGHKTHIECLIRVLSTSDNCIYCRKKLNLQCTEPRMHHIPRDFDNRTILDDNEYEDSAPFIKMFWEKFCSMFYEQLLYAFKLGIGICLIVVIILFA